MNKEKYLHDLKEAQFKIKLLINLMEEKKEDKYLDLIKTEALKITHAVEKFQNLNK